LIERTEETQGNRKAYATKEGEASGGSEAQGGKKQQRWDRDKSSTESRNRKRCGGGRVHRSGGGKVVVGGLLRIIGSCGLLVDIKEESKLGTSAGGLSR